MATDNGVLTGSAPAHRGRRTLLILFAVAFVPLMAAYIVFFFFPSLVPEGRTNRGTLINPPAQALELFGEGPAGVAEGKWTLYLHTADRCDQVCLDTAYLSRQVNIALGKDSDRVQRVLLIEANDLSPEDRGRLSRDYPKMKLAFGANLSLPPALPTKEVRDVIYLADPLGNVMMYYRTAEGGKPMLEDLKHLLKLSNIG